ncbi:MAG: hypothetical protein NVSMB64_12120 [Candidatus Velthaea sp.]
MRTGGLFGVSAAELRWWLAAIVAFSLFAVLGALVSRRTPTRLDVEAVALRGRATNAAALFTHLGYWPAIATVSVSAAIGALLFRADVAAVGVLVAVQSVSQVVLAGTKLAFRRTRPDYWLVRKEADLSFPSGHAASAVVMYLGLLALVARTPALPHAAAISLLTALALCTIGIPWSRLALGAHYLTDVAGGLLFGAGSLCLAIALLLHRGRITG